MGVNILIKIENFAILCASIYAYYVLDFSWLAFAFLFFIFDISMFGYFIDNKIGATIYNIFHTYTLPFLFLFISYFFNFHSVVGVSIIWISHIAFDRFLGYGLKLDSFHNTHLN